MLTRRFAPCLVLLALAGCGGGGPPTASVSGVVTLNGSPLADASVSTQPVGDEAGPGSFAKTDARGRFTLSLVGGGSGAVVGKHRVVISKGDRPPSTDESATGAKETLPERYNAKTELTLEVPAGGKSDVKLELTKP